MKNNLVFDGAQITSSNDCNIIYHNKYYACNVNFEKTNNIILLSYVVESLNSDKYKKNIYVDASRSFIVANDDEEIFPKLNFSSMYISHTWNFGYDDRFKSRIINRNCLYTKQIYKRLVSHEKFYFSYDSTLEFRNKLIDNIDSLFGGQK